MTTDEILKQAHKMFPRGSQIKLHSVNVTKYVKHPFYWAHNKLWDGSSYGVIYDNGFKPILISKPTRTVEIY